MKNSIYIFGAGGLGREIAALIRSMQDWNLQGFVDDNRKRGDHVDGVPCYGNMDELIVGKENIHLIIGVGDPVTKADILNRLMKYQSIQYPHLVHPAARILDPSRVTVEQGSVITAGCVLTTGISIGKHTLINLNTTIGHDCVIGDGCSVMPGVHLAGEVKIGNGVLVGSGANILNGIVIGDHARIGAGSVVLENVRPGATVVGVPAKELVKG